MHTHTHSQSINISAVNYPSGGLGQRLSAVCHISDYIWNEDEAGHDEEEKNNNISVWFVFLFFIKPPVSQ